MSAPLIDNILTLSLTTIEGRTPAVGTNTAIFCSEDANASVNGTLYRSATDIDADAAALTATTVAKLKAILAEGPRVGGVYVYVYDQAGGEDPSNALTAAATAGILPMWSYVYIVIESRDDTNIAAASTWLHTNGRGRAIVLGQLSTASILSGTKPAGVAASAGADLSVVYYDDTDTNVGVEALTGFWAATDVDRQRPSCGIATPLGLPNYATELSKTQVATASGRDSGQSACIVSKRLYAGASKRTAYQGHTVGGTLVEVELGAIITGAKIYQAVATLVESRSQPGGVPLRTTDADASAIEAVIVGVLRSQVVAGYIETGVAADPATGRPNLPDGFEVTVTFNGQTAEVRGWAAYPGDVRAISFDLTGFVS